MAFIDYQDIQNSPYAGMFDSYWTGEGTDYAAKSQYAPYITNVAGGEYQAKGFDFNEAAYNQYLSSQPAVGGGTQAPSASGFTPLTYTPQQALQAYQAAASGSQPYGGAGLPSDVLRQAQGILGDSMWGGVENYLTNTYTNPNSFQFGPGFEWGTNLQANDPLAFLGNTYIGGQNSWAQQDFTNQMLQSIMTPEQYAQLASTQQQQGQLTEAINVANAASPIPWGMLALAAGGFLGAGMLLPAMGFAAGSPMAAGGLLGEVGAGLGGAVASAGGAALDASALAAMGYNPANASLGGLTGATSGGGSLGGANGSWDILPDAVSQPTGGALPGDAGATGGIAPDVNADLTALMDSPAGGGGSMTDWWTQAISPGSNYTLSDLASIAGIPSTGGGSDLLQQLLGGQGGGSGTGTGTGTGGTGTGGLGGMGDIFNWLTSAQGGAGALSGILGYNDAADQTDWMKQTMERAVGASDPYGYGPYRKYAADQLQRTYQDPASIYASPEMQALDQMFMDKTMAGQSVSGNLFNAPERVAQRQNNFYSNLNDYRKPLLQMSGSGQALVAPQTYASFAKSISDLQGDQALAKGNMIGGITGGLNTLFGGGGSGGQTGGSTGGFGDIWNLISGGGFGGGISGLPTGGDWSWDWPDLDIAASGINGGSGDYFYGANDLLDLWL